MGRMTVTRQILIAVFTSLFVLFAIIYPQTAQAIDLKRNSVLSDSTIKLGDIFTGLPHSADKILGPAPLPGQEMVLNARTLMRIAIALDLPWRPANVGDYVVLTRAANIVEQSVIEDAIKDALKEEGVDGSYSLLIPNHPTEIVLPMDQPTQVEVSNINLMSDQKRFEATLVAPSKDNPVYRSTVYGSIERMVEVPVLREALRAGTTIGKRDIEMKEIPERNLKSGMILEAENLLGTTPRRILKADEPILITEIEEPRIVARGEYVTMTFEHGSLQLTARGKALEDGAKGDAIRVVNTNSNKTIEAIVTASKEVSVKTF